VCGIAGAARLDGLDPEPVPQMVRSLAHRGPDAQGLAVLGPPGAPWAALGVRRLAIVDPAGGHQPAWDARGQVVVTMNGEIYNHRRLRQELEADGVPLRSRSDTEVLAQLIARLGLDGALARCVGMFAAAVAWPGERRLALVRDRMGVKPLFWAQLTDGALIWGSELRALLRHPGLRRRLDHAAISAYLQAEYIPTPLSPWEGVKQLAAGHALELGPAGPALRRWWTPPIPERGAAGDLDRWARSVHGCLQVAVRQRLDADVPVGVLLSGGLDSSGVAAVARALHPGPLESFSVGVRAAGFDESDRAAAVARHLGLRHHPIPMELDEVGPLAEAAAAHLDQPVADSSIVPTWKLMGAVQAAGLRCVLSGDGADECFAGYPTTWAHQLAPAASAASGIVRSVVSRIPQRGDGVTKGDLARRFAVGLGRPWARRHAAWMGAWLPEELRGEDGLGPILDETAAPVAAADPLSRALYLDQRLYLRDGVLVKVDRASMAHSVEVRSPYLDHRMVELAASIGAGHHRRGPEGKRVLRAALSGLLPPELLGGPKRGFGGPVGPWLRGRPEGELMALAEVAEEWISPDRVRAAVRAHRSGAADERRRLWALWMLRRWREGPWGGT
jgi:asparagine synthase (glutamine-hydrolysing)